MFTDVLHPVWVKIGWQFQGEMDQIQGEFRGFECYRSGWPNALVEQLVWRARLPFLVADEGFPEVEKCCWMSGQNNGGSGKSADRSGCWGGRQKRSAAEKERSGADGSEGANRDMSELAAWFLSTVGMNGGQKREEAWLSAGDVMTSCLSSVFTSSGNFLLLCRVSSRQESRGREELLWPLRYFALLFLNHTCTKNQQREREREYLHLGQN